jgi:hypothetical protein
MLRALGQLAPQFLLSMKSTAPGRIPLPIMDSLTHIVAYNNRAKQAAIGSCITCACGQLLYVGHSMEHVQKCAALTPQLKAQLPQPKP